MAAEHSRADVNTVRCHDMLANRERMIAGEIENKIVADRTGCKIFLSIVDDTVGPEGSDQIGIARAAYGGDLRTEDFAELHCECAHAAGRAVDVDALAGLNFSVIAKTL